MILVTGASGFLGQHLVQHLSAQGREVRALYHHTLPGAALKDLKGVTWMSCDLLDIFEVEEAMKGITEVYHCAAVVSFLPKDRKQIIHTNVESTANIVNEALEQGIRKMIFVSSVAALGRNQAQKEINEDEEWEESEQNSAYGISKYMAEMEVWRGIGEGLNAVVINPGIILGEGNWNTGSAQMIKVAYDEFPFYTEGINAWVDVKDVVHAMDMLMKSPIQAERFIMSAGNYAYKEIFAMMARSLDRRAPRIKASELMTGIVWRLGALKYSIMGTKPLITRETARNAHKQSLYNNEKLLRYLPEFSYTPVEQTIQRMAKAYLTRSKLNA
ncbi:MAG: NAD-dependent epimerase/dehydratase family protein [Bacteroidota bacterium]